MSTRGTLRGFSQPLVPGMPGNQYGYGSVNGKSVPIGHGEPLIWYPCTSLVYDADIITTRTFTADSGVLFTNDVAGKGGIPIDGSVVAFSVHLLIANSTAVTCSAWFYDYESNIGTSGGIEARTGLAANMPIGNYGQMVYTGGKNNTQFKYQVDWNSGTLTLYPRITGYYRRQR